MHVCSDVSGRKTQKCHKHTYLTTMLPCGPECSIGSKVPSDKRFTRGAMLSDWQKLHTCMHNHHVSQCICWKCVKALRRQVCTAAKENKPPVCQSTCSVHDCSAAASVHSPADKLHVHRLNEQCEPVPCPAHYSEFTSSVSAMQHVLGVSRGSHQNTGQVEVTKLSTCRA